MTHIAIATCTDQSNLYYDEAPLVAELNRNGFEVYPVVWNSPEIDWESYDIVLLRNTWDYHQQVSAFQAWLAYLDDRRIRVVNPTSLLRWNMTKTYLQALADHGIRIHPTVFAHNQEIPLHQLMQERQWARIVVKPIISGSGDNTWVINTETVSAAQRKFDWLNEGVGMMIQPFAPQIRDEGEYSLVFFQGEYSHAVVKTVGPDGIFVHEERGGTVSRIDPPKSLISSAQNIVQTVHGITGVMPLYARVDGIRVDGDLVLMECECVEPELYFTRAPLASERFVSALTAIL